MRKIIALAAISSLSLMVSACGEKQPEAEATEATEAAEPAEDAMAAPAADAMAEPAAEDAAAPEGDGEAEEDDRTGGIDKR